MGVRSTLWSSRSTAKSHAVSWPSRHQDRARGSGFEAARPSSGMLRRHRRFFCACRFPAVGDAARGRAGLPPRRRVDPHGGAHASAGAQCPSTARVDHASQADRRLSARSYWPSSGSTPHKSGTLQAAIRQLQGPDRPRRPQGLLGNEWSTKARGSSCATGRWSATDLFARMNDDLRARGSVSWSRPRRALRAFIRTTCRSGRKIQAGRPNTICFWRALRRKEFRLSICDPRSRRLALAARSFICTIRIGHSAARWPRLTQLSRRTPTRIGGSTRAQP